MVATVNKIPSINLPLTNEQGVIHPIWYEFFRSFISGIESDVGAIDTGEIILAGDGLSKSGSTLNVKPGNGINVNNDSVNVDINGQINAQASLEDEILIVDASNGSTIRKTTLRDVANLSPGTFPGGSSNAVQYNSSDTFEGDNNFTTDGSGSISITGDLTVDNVNINGTTLSSNSSSNPFKFEVPGGGLDQFTFQQSGIGSSAFKANFIGNKSSATVLIRSDVDDGTNLADAVLSFATNTGNAEWTMGLYDNQDDDFVFANSAGLNTGQIFTVDRGNNTFTHHTNVVFESGIASSTTTGITASTTQSQGQGALTTELNEISTCANTNDTVTLQAASAGKSQIVINNGAQTLQIFPASGDDLGAGVDTSTTLTAGSSAWFIAYDGTNYVQLI